MTIARSPVRSVSVVVPVRNGAGTLPQQLAALAEQRVDVPWEVVVVDHGSSDGSGPLAETWAPRLPVTVVRTDGPPGVAHARNTGARASTGDLIALCDADDVVSGGWLASLVRAASDADVVAGRLVPVGRDLTPLADDPATDAPLALEFLPYAVGANCAIRREVLDHLHGWDEAYVAGADDIELSWRAQLAGFRVAYAPDAVVRYRARPSASSTIAQAFRYGLLDHRLYRDFRARGLRRPTVRSAVAAWGWVVTRAPDLVRPRYRQRWLVTAGHRAGRLAGLVRYRQLVM